MIETTLSLAILVCLTYVLLNFKSGKVTWKKTEPYREPVAFFLSVSVAAFAVFYFFTDRKIEQQMAEAQRVAESAATKAVLDESFLADLAARVRPLCVFDTRGAVEADLGASEYIDLDSIEVIPVPKIYGYEILVRAKTHLAYAPLVAGVDVSLYPQTVTRGRSNYWSFVLTPQTTTPGLLAEGYPDTNIVYRFKLEVLH